MADKNKVKKIKKGIMRNKSRPRPINTVDQNLKDESNSIIPVEVKFLLYAIALLTLTVICIEVYQLSC